MRLPLSMIFIAARSSAEPPTAIEREPKVPVPNGTWSVSPSMISICAIGTPSRDARICAKVVAWPWPWLWVPSSACTLPSGCTRIVRRLEEADAGAERRGEARRRDARGFHVARHADAAQLARARGGGLRAGKARVVRDLHQRARTPSGKSPQS